MNRRDFLKSMLSTAVSFSPLMSFLGSAQRLEAANLNDYKALVVVLLEGGNDAFNMVVPSSQAAYGKYEAVREGVHLKQSDLLPMNAAKTYSDGITYGMHPKMQEMRDLYNNENLAIIANVGTLVEPVTKTEVENGSKKVPFQLYAHNTQRAMWLTGNAALVEKSGWAARTADTFYNEPSYFFNITVEGDNLLQTGGKATAYPFRNEPSVSPNSITNFGFGAESGGGLVGSVYKDLVTEGINEDHKLLSAYADLRNTEIELHEQLIADFNANDVQLDLPQFDGINYPHEIGTGIETQLHMVAKLLTKKDNFPTKPARQIFFVNFHGWDTHAAQNDGHPVLTEYLSRSLGAFYRALEANGLEDMVTTLTVSDFGRSLTSNGSGTDHGWGGHAFVVGGAVKGGDIYGLMPKIEKDSPDATLNRVIPTTSAEQYLSPILKWFGANENELDTIFPNRKSFDDKGLWFMS